MNLGSDDDIPLSEEGVRHGKRIFSVLKKEPILDLSRTRIICSPYLRTKQTRGILFPGFDDRVHIDPRLCERNNGWCANMTRSEVRMHFPWLEEYWDKTNPLLATPPGGESILAVVYRVMSVISEIIESRHQEADTTLIIGHGNLFKAIDFILKDLTFNEYPTIPNAPNGSFTLYRNVHLGKRGMNVDFYHKVLSE